MAHNDMYVVMYRIVAYLYDRMKKGERPVDSEWSASALGIPDRYWSRIVSELASHGYVGGVAVTEVGSGDIVVCLVDPYVTMEGVAFAKENSMMAKAKRFLQDAKSSVPFV